MPRQQFIVSASRTKDPAHPQSLWVVLDKPQSLSRPLILRGSISLDTSIRQGGVVVEGMDSGVQKNCVQSMVLTLTLCDLRQAPYSLRLGSLVVTLSL